MKLQTIIPLCGVELKTTQVRQVVKAVRSEATDVAQENTVFTVRQVLNVPVKFK